MKTGCVYNNQSQDFLFEIRNSGYERTTNRLKANKTYEPKQNAVDMGEIEGKILEIHFIIFV